MPDDSDRKRETASAFGAAADAYLDSTAHAEGADLERLGEWCAGADRALDVACGPGHTAGALRRAGVPAVVAADVTPAMVRTAVDAFDVAGVVADAEALPFRDDAFDAVTCRIAAHHFPDPEAFLREAARVLEPGGTVAFEDNVAPDDPERAAFFNRVERLRDPTHEAAYPHSQWRDWFAAAGFTVTETETMWKDIEYGPWVERTDPSPARRDELASLIRSPEAAAVFGVSLADDEVVAFGNRKLLLRATR